MTILSAQSLRARHALPEDDARRIVVDPLMPDAIGPHSIDVRLGATLLVWTPIKGPTLKDGVFQSLGATEDGWYLSPRNFYLGSTLEYVGVPTDLRCQLDGNSTEARRSIVIHQTGGSIDAGWRGHLTVELTVTIPQWLKAAGRIGQLTFSLLDAPTDMPYVGRYQGDLFPTPPREKVR